MIGAFAVIAHGDVGATADIDLVARQDPDNLQHLAAAFAELQARLRNVVRVVGLGDLIRIKRASGRPQDLRDIANLSPPAEGNE